MTMRANRVVFAVLCAVLFGWKDAFSLYAGPKENEKGIYIYMTYKGRYKHCLYCPEGAFFNTSMNKMTQEQACSSKYDDINKEIKPSELKNELIPICKVGTVPGCGPPPEKDATAGLLWHCDPGFSNVTYSVYFSCALIREETGKELLSYYCNEDLRWELSTNLSERLSTNIHKGDDGPGFKLVLILVCSAGTIFIICLVTIVCIIYRWKRTTPSITSNNERGVTSALLTSQEPVVSSQSCYHEIAKKDRLPPYGEETPCIRKNADDHVQTPQAVLEDEESHDVRSRVLAEAKSNPFPYSRQLIDINLNSDDKPDEPETRVNIPHDQHPNKSTVRADFIRSGEENARKCQTFLYKKPESKINAVSPMSARNLDKNNLTKGPLEGKTDMARLKDVTKEKPIREELASGRPNPLGKNSISTFTESTYYKNENDPIHNTEPKTVAGDGDDSGEYTMSAAGRTLSSQVSKQPAYGSNDKNNPNCSNTSSFELRIDELNDLNDSNSRNTRQISDFLTADADDLEVSFEIDMEKL